MRRLNMWIDPDDPSPNGRWFFVDQEDWNHEYGEGEPLKASTGDILAFYLGSKEKIDISSVTVSQTPEEGRTPPSPFTGFNGGCTHNPFRSGWL